MVSRSKSPAVPTPAAPQLPPLDAAQRYSLAEACGYLRISRVNVWAKAKRGELVVIREGKRTFVPGSEIVRLCRAPEAA